jgi:hypothetical protein
MNQSFHLLANSSDSLPAMLHRQLKVGFGAIATGVTLAGGSAAMLLAASNASAQVPAAPIEAPPGYQIIQRDAWAFAVPDDWESTEITPPRSPDVELVAQLRDTQGQIFVNLVTEPFAADSIEYIDLNLETMRSIGFQIHRQESVSVGMVEGGEIESTLPAQPPVRALQRVTVSDGTGYALTCGSLESSFETVRPTCEAIMESFQVMPAGS